MAKRFGFKCDGQAIAVEFTDQKLSANAGSAPFWAWLHGTYWNVKLAERLPHRAPASEDHLRAVPLRERAWWSRLWEEILSLLPNCNTVDIQPTFAD